MMRSIMTTMVPALLVALLLLWQQDPSTCCWAFRAAGPSWYTHHTAGYSTMRQFQTKLLDPLKNVKQQSSSSSVVAAAAAVALSLSSSSSSSGSSSAPPATAEQEHARAQQVFASFDKDGSGTISAAELAEMLAELEMEATPDEARALFHYLDTDDDGEIGVEDFLPWYSAAASSAHQVAASFQSLLLGRRTVDHFDETPVNDDVLRRAVECAIAAPNRSGSEPWRFFRVGPETVQKLVRLKRKLQKNMETDDGQSSVLDWTRIPGWCVVTTKLTPDQPDAELEDFRSTACAIQNFMLSMWSEGIGTKWTSGPVQKTPEFAQLCGIDGARERVVGCIWFGFPTGGLVAADPKRRKKTVDDVLSTLP